MMYYSSITLWSCRYAIKTKSTLLNHHLNTTTRTWIIAPGIKKQPLNHPHCHSNAGPHLFHEIYQSITTKQPTCTQSDRGICLTNPTCITLDKSSNKPKLLKLASFQQLITDEYINVCAITETWIKPEDDFTPKQIPPPHYDILSFPCLNGKQGGEDSTSLQGPLSNKSQCQHQINIWIPRLHSRNLKAV